MVYFKTRNKKTGKKGFENLSAVFQHETKMNVVVFSFKQKRLVKLLI